MVHCRLYVLTDGNLSASLRFRVSSEFDKKIDILAQRLEAGQLFERERHDMMQGTVGNEVSSCEEIVFVSVKLLCVQHMIFICVHCTVQHKLFIGSVIF